MLFAAPLTVLANSEEHHETKENSAFNPGKLISEHVSDSYGWHIWGEGSQSVSIPLPVVIYSTERGLDVFMSSHFHHGHSTYKGYALIHNKVVAVDQLNEVSIEESTTNEQLSESLYDISITKNVVSLFVSLIIMFIMFASVAKAYKRREGQAPKGLQSLIEPLVIFVRDDIAKSSISGKDKYKKFLPYLLTVFFFIWINNLLGLIPIFPGGANLTGSISVTMVLALITFVITTVNANKHYWRHVFAMPGVPGWVLILLTPIEILGVFLRPFVLMIRLFANILAGHIIILSFISLIFIFGEMSVGAGFGVAVFSVAFTIFMTFLELLVAFLQAYVFTLLSAMYFGAAIEEHDHDTPDHDAKVEEALLI